MIIKKSTLNMTETDWLADRRESIGGSDAATIVGLNPYSSPYELWADKLGRIPPKESNEAMRLGHDLEQYVAERFTEATGKRVRRENNIIRNTDIPFAHANVDRLIIGEKAGLECKTTSALNTSKFKGGEFPANYYVQCQHYMMVTGFKKWYLAVLVLGREFLWFEIERNEEDIEALKQAEEEFWYKVGIKQPPDTDGSHSCSATLEMLYPEGEDSETDLTPYHTALKEHEQLCVRIKELEAQKAAFENDIKAYMQESGTGLCEGFKVTWKTQLRKTFDKALLLKEHPDIDISRYMKESSSRVFKIKEV